MSRADVRVMDTGLPGCALIINKRTHFWYLVERTSRTVIDYGSCAEHRRAAYMALSRNDTAAQRMYERASMEGSD